ncbi:MAG: SDR family NAD(P)-dependent oxidoreductase [Cytophagales bacterium]|jgi:NADP-dependent 3-hydroxy acid dehydrogenase YdfG|nr:SDR family NAD(P)-dependent oxidoreductase [Cytophagales bacterium]
MYRLTALYPQKRAFITGAGSGFGKALALELAADGWTVGLADLNADRLAETEQEVTQLGGQPIVLPLDVTDKVRFKQISENFLAQTGGIDVLFNNAGIGDGGVFELYPLELWERMVAINQMGVVHGCWFFIPTLKKQKSGMIVNTASFAAVGAAPEMAAYNMTKAAVTALSETLYVELMDFNIRVCNVMPGYFQTNIAEGASTELSRKITQRRLDKSGLSPQQVAEEVLTRAAEGELYILLPEYAREAWRLKRENPEQYRMMIKEMMDKEREKFKMMNKE